MGAKQPAAKKTDAVRSKADEDWWMTWPGFVQTGWHWFCWLSAARWGQRRRRAVVPAAVERETFSPSATRPADGGVPFMGGTIHWPRAGLGCESDAEVAGVSTGLPRRAPGLGPVASQQQQRRPAGRGNCCPTASSIRRTGRSQEPRLASVWNHDSRWGWMWDLEAGSRMALVRYGAAGLPRPDGWELDIEGAAFPRLDIDHEQDLISADFRVGIPLTYGWGPFQAKLAGYHLSSHLGDEYLLRFPDDGRVNYSRNALVLGGSYYVRDDLRLYAEAEWAFYTDGGSQPWEFQFGLDYAPAWGADSRRGAPFVALNGHLREEVDYGGSFVVQAGWQWRGPTNHLFRVGAQYFTGKSDQYQFCQRNEDKVGIGVWYDF